MAWGSSSSWCQGHICLRWIPVKLWSCVSCQRMFVVTSQQDLCGCAAELLFPSPSHGCAGYQEGRRDYPAFKPAVLWETAGTLLSALLSLSSFWALDNTGHSWCNEGLWTQSINISGTVSPGNICDSSYQGLHISAQLNMPKSVRQQITHLWGVQRKMWCQFTKGSPSTCIGDVIRTLKS